METMQNAHPSTSPMRLAVLGAGGRSGRPLVEQALAAGHQVRALVRDPHKLGPLAAHVEVIQGDASTPADLDRVVQGSDAVLNVLGWVPGAPDDLLTRSTLRLALAMGAHGVSRLIVLSGAAVLLPEDHRTLGTRLASLATVLMIPRQVQDKREQLAVLAASALDWTALRAPELTEGDFSGHFTVGFVPRPATARLSRADVAAALLAQLTDPRWHRQAPMVMPSRA